MAETARRKNKKETEKLQKQLNLYLDNLEKSKTQSPYYMMYKNFYKNQIPSKVDLEKLPPWAKAKVFEKGFSSIYTQKSYAYRPGYWLVIQLRAYKAAREMYNWI